jgi:hypothetical protein
LGQLKYPTVGKVVKACLVFSHGNSDGERSFYQLFSRMTRKLENENLFMITGNTSLLVLLSLTAMCTFTSKSRKIDSAASQAHPSG